MIRLTTAAFAAATGGADAIVLGAFTDALGAPTAFARRQSRNIQLVLAEEANVGRVIDPAGGAGYLEALTDAAGLRRLGPLPGHRGRRRRGPRAGEPGIIAETAQRVRAELSARLGAKRVRVLGVTDFPDAEGRDAGGRRRASAPAVDAPSPRLPGPDSHCPPLIAIRLEDLA